MEYYIAVTTRNCGKSQIMLEEINKLLEQGYKVRFVRASDFKKGKDNNGFKKLHKL